MSKSKIKLCRYSTPFVEELTPSWEPRYENQAERCVRKMNDSIIAEGEFDNEFWFLEKNIKGKTTIIILATNQNLINDAAILAKLEVYLSKDDKFDGSSKNRSKFNRY